MTFRIKTSGITTLSIMTYSITKLNITTINAIFRITALSIKCDNAQFHNFFVMLSVALFIVMLRVTESSRCPSVSYLVATTYLSNDSL
jgi:hypothetical protein